MELTGKYRIIRENAVVGEAEVGPDGSITAIYRPSEKCVYHGKGSVQYGGVQPGPVNGTVNFAIQFGSQLPVGGPGTKFGFSFNGNKAADGSLALQGHLSPVAPAFRQVYKFSAEKEATDG